MDRSFNRKKNELRPVEFVRNYTCNADGSVLVTFGQTKVICTACVERGVPHFLKNTGEGWLTAEYGMLPGSTSTRVSREAVKGKQAGRTVEIQRLIGRSLRNMLNLKLLGEYTIKVDCDVLQADGGTRTAAITGAAIAVKDAFDGMVNSTSFPEVKQSLFLDWVMAVSVGVVGGVPLLDLDYSEDSQADVDMNVVVNGSGEYVEVQGTSEKQVFDDAQLLEMLALAKIGVAEINKKIEALYI